MTGLALLLIYPLGWMAAIQSFVKIFYYFPDKTYSLSDRFLLWIVFLVPMGKLVYFNVPGLMGFKFSFFVWALACMAYFGSWLALKRFGMFRFQIFLLFLFFPIFSLILQGNISELVYYSGDEQSDSLGARLVALVFLMIFSAAIYDLCRRHGFEIVVRFFIHGVITATIVGCFIFFLVLTGVIGVPDLMPISADTHIVDIVYRFNPGGNVNEFGFIAIYALLMMQMGYPSMSRIKQYTLYGLLLFALFFSLTRAAWLAYAGALVLMSAVSGQGRKLLILGTVSFAMIVLIVYQLGDEFSNIVVTRFAVEGGASGDERLEKATEAFLSNEVSILQIIFGHGWATNLYLHSVPLQLIYEIGIAGFLLTSSAMGWAIIKLIVRVRRNLPGALPLLGCLTAFAIGSAFHHTIYHMQTWFVVGLILYIAFSPKTAVTSQHYFLRSL